MIHRVILCVAAFVIGGGLPLFSAEPTWVTYPAKDGPGQGRHVVLLSGDEEYRSEEALPMLGKILSQRHGFKCTVLFSVDADGTINPDNQRSLSHPEALDSADVIVMSLRFRKWPDDVMKRFVDAYLAGKPIIALRTSTHAFDYPKGSTYARYGWTSGEWKGGFGKQVLGETWVSHWGRHKVEATRGVLEPAAQSDPLLRGIESLFGDTDVYEAYPPADAKILVRGQVLTGMKPTDPPATYRKKRASDGQEQAVNEPMMPVAWSRIHTNEAGRLNKILCTTMGSATDLQDEGLRRLLVNGVYWALGLEVPARANVDYVGEFKPTMYGFKGYQKGVKPSVHALNAKPAATAPAPAPVPGKLTLQKGDHIALIGNALAERMQHDSAFETLLHRAFPEHDLTVRNLGFSGDEIVTRARSENFGSPDDWLTRVKADVILAFFGFNESFKGYGGLDKFRSDLANFIKDTLGKNYSGKGPPRLVLVSPIAAERLPDPNFPDPSLINDNLRDYTLAMADVARAHGVQLVNLFDLSKQLQAASATPLTHNGIHLTEAGNERLAPVLFRELLGQEPPAWDAATEQLRRAVQEKNRMWFSRYRTVDGYNVYGGRSALAYQPDKGGFISDRDAPEPHVSNYKVMQREMAIRDVMTENRDRRVWALARGRDLKVDDSNAPEPIPVKTNKPGPKEDKSHEYLDGEAAIARMKLAPGCRVGLFASEKEFPALVNPVQMAWDTRGRLWVAVWPNYPERTPWSTNGDSLVVFEDTNADGRADKMTTFIDDLNCPTGFQFYKDGVILVQAPDVWFVRDTDGDGRADWKERILGSLDSADSHHTANALCLDPGGAIYLSDGVFHRTQVETARGPVRNVDGAIYRFEPRTGRFEVYVAYGFANPHGRVFDYWGNDLITDATGNNTYFGPAFSGRLDSGKHSSLEEFWKRPSRPCPGTAILSSRHFPEEFQGNFLNCNVISLLAIFRAKIREEGSGLRGETLEHLVISDDPNFRPSAVTVAPDGSIYFTDWHQAIIGHMQHHLRDPNRDHRHGRIYRITYPSRPLLTPPPIAGQPIEKLLDLLKEPEDNTRERAKIELGGRDTGEVIAAVQKWMRQFDPARVSDQHHLMEALWVHQWHNVVNEPLLRQMLRSPEPRARAAATRVLCYWRERVPDALALLKIQANDDSPRVRLEAVRAFSFFSGEEAVRGALEAARHPMDYYLEYTLGETLRQIMPRPEDVVIPDDPGAAAWVLKRVKPADLDRLPRTEPLLLALLTRPGLDLNARNTALDELVQRRKSGRVVELLALLRHLSSGEGETPLADDLGKMLAASPAADLARAREPLLALAREGSPPGVRRAAWAGVITADNDPARTWTTAGTTAARVDLIQSLGLLFDTDLRARFQPHLVAALAQEKDPACRAASLRALPLMGADHAAANFKLAADFVTAGGQMDAAIAALRAFPVASWDTNAAGPLARAIISQAEKTPSGRKNRESLALQLQLAGDLVGWLPPEEAAPLRARLKELRVPVFVIKTVREGMRYDVSRIVVEPGKDIDIILENDDFMPHNLVVVAPGAREEIGRKGGAMAPDDPGKQGRPYVPRSDKVLAATKLLEAGQRERLTFKTPEKEGIYEYLCTFPDHWMSMWGQLVVTSDIEGYLQKNPLAPVPVPAGAHANHQH